MWYEYDDNKWLTGIDDDPFFTANKLAIAAYKNEVWSEKRNKNFHAQLKQ